jgi:sugar phosphate isomerase/epimerase
MSVDQLPVLGAAMPLAKLPKHLAWLNEGSRPLEIDDPVSPEVLDGNWKTVAQKMKSLLADYSGVFGIHGPFINLNIAPYDPKIRQVVSDRLRQGLDFAHEVGATHMVVHSPYEFFGGPFTPHSPHYGLSRDLDRAQELLGPIVLLAEAAKCTLVVENIFDINSAPLLALVRSFESPFVRMSLDTGHAFITHRRGGPTPDQWVVDASDLLAHVHVEDNDGQFDHHWRPGHGNINWFAFFAALKKTGATPRLILELNNADEIEPTTMWLSSLGLAR